MALLRLTGVLESLLVTEYAVYQPSSSICLFGVLCPSMTYHIPNAVKILIQNSGFLSMCEMLAVRFPELDSVLGEAVRVKWGLFGGQI